MTEKILILDFGSQYTQLIARAVREANVYCEIIPFHKKFEFEPGLKGIILSGSPFSVNEGKAPDVNVQEFITKVPVLGICYGAQLTAKRFGGLVAKSNKREYGRAILHRTKEDVLLKDVSEQSQVWMSHSDTIKELPEGFELLADTESIPVAAFKRSEVRDQKSENGRSGSSIRLQPSDFPLYGVQFHPEVYHSKEGKKILKNFLVNICGCSQDWTPAHFITNTIEALKKQIGDRKVIMALSGGVDSTVAATLVHSAIGKNLYGIFVDNGVLRKGEFESVIKTYNQLGLNVNGTFSGLKGTIIFDNLDLKSSEINVSVNSNSVNTDNTARDKHLRKDEYFNVEKFPLISFISNKIEKATRLNRYNIDGILTIKGISRPIKFELVAIEKENNIELKCNFEINRRTFKVGENSLVLSDNVKMNLIILASK